MHSKTSLTYFTVLFHACYEGNKFTIGSTQILLMAIVILLLCLIIENSEKPKRVVVVGDKLVKKGDKSE
jgi:hypothetical protein